MKKKLLLKFKELLVLITLYHEALCEVVDEGYEVFCELVEDYAIAKGIVSNDIMQDLDSDYEVYVRNEGKIGVFTKDNIVERFYDMLSETKTVAFSRYICDKWTEDDENFAAYLFDSNETFLQLLERSSLTTEHNAEAKLKFEDYKIFDNFDDLTIRKIVKDYYEIDSDYAIKKYPQVAKYMLHYIGLWEFEHLVNTYAKLLIDAFDLDCEKVEFDELQYVMSPSYFADVLENINY